MSRQVAHGKSNRPRAQQHHASQVQQDASQKRLQSEQKLQQRAALRAQFGAQATRIKITVYIVLLVALLLTGLAFFSSNWLEVERRYYGSKFKRLGLWRMCFNSFSAPDDFQFKKFYVGCRWVFADEYKPLRKFILPGSY